MLRESRARWLALATAGTVVALAAWFAGLRNPIAQAPQAPQGGAAVDAQAAARGSAQPASGPAAATPWDPVRQAAARAVFTRLDCARCHSIDGLGSARLPLDGVGARLDRAALRNWSLGTGAAAEALPRSALRAKARAAEEAEDAEVELLIDYLAAGR